MTTDEILAYQAAVRAIGSAHAEKVRRRGGSPAEMADAYVSVMEWCGWPEPDVRKIPPQDVAIVQRGG